MLRPNIHTYLWSPAPTRVTAHTVRRANRFSHPSLLHLDPCLTLRGGEA